MGDATHISGPAPVQISDRAMTLGKFRSQMQSYRRSVDEEARSRKDSYYALEKLHAFYQGFDGHERKLADQVLAE